MGGPGGLVGWTRIVGVRLDPTAPTSISPGLASARRDAHGVNTDTINLAWTTSGVPPT
jgi:hypothetical protein